MRAITGSVLSSQPCSLSKAARIITRFADSAASHLPSADAATYLRTDAHHLFRRELRNYPAPSPASASSSVRNINKSSLIPALAPASASASVRKINKEKHSKEHHESPTLLEQAVEEIASPDKTRNKKKHPEEVKTDARDDKRIIASAGDLGSLAAEQGLGREKKRKKKRERGDDNDNDQEQVEHTRKKPRNRS